MEPFIFCSFLWWRTIGNHQTVYRTATVLKPKSCLISPPRTTGFYGTVDKLLIKRARVPLEQQISDDEFLKELRGDNNAPPAVAPAYNSMPLEFIKLLQKDVNAIIASGNSHKEIAEDKNIAMILRGELCIDADGIIAIANKYGFSPDKYLVLAGYIPECILRLYNHDAFRFLFDNIDNLTDAEIDAIGNSMKVLVRALLNAKNPDSKQQ